MTEADEVLAAASAMRIVRGDPDDEELAALVAGMVAVAASVSIEEEQPLASSAWMDRLRTMRGRPISGPLGRGPHAWRTSLR